MLSVLKTNIKIALLLSAGILFLATAAPAGQKQALNKGIVKASKLNVRKTPSSASDVVTVVEKGKTLVVIGKADANGRWLAVEYKGEKGYVRNRPQYIRLVTAPPKMKKRKKGLQSKLPNKQVKKVPSKNELAKIEEKQALEARIEAEEKKAATFSQKEVEIIEQLNEIDYTLNKTRRKMLALSTENMQLEGKIEQLHRKKEKLSQEIIQNREYAGNRLRAIYKMNMIGRLDASGLPASVFDFFLQQNSMKRIIASDYAVVEKQALVLEKYAVLEQELKTEIQAKAVLEKEFADQIRIHDEETLKKELILRQIRKKKKLSLAAVDALKHAALKLDHQIANLKNNTVSELDEFSFSSYKGQLSIPVKGKIISTFGPEMTGDYKSFTFQKGIDIRVERGEPVKSVFKGEILFAQWLKGYGNLLIINHGENYYTLYGHVEEIFKKEGETVEKGEVIATAGDTGSIKGMCLHFELRHHGKPLNPLKWLKKGA